MKIIYLTVCIALLLLPVVLSAQYNQDATLLEIPTPAHQRPVSVYFAGESKPPKPYLRLAYIAMGKGDAQNLTPTIELLKQRAQLLGADAIIILGGTNKVRVVNMGEWVEEQVISDLEALAVVYPENLQFVPGCVKAWHVLKPDSTGRSWERVGSQLFSPKGQPSGTEGNIKWLDWWEKRSHSYIMDSPWYFTKDEFGRKSRIDLPNNQRARVIYTSTESRKIKKLNLFSSGELTGSITYTFEDKGNRIKSREIVMGIDKNRSHIEYPEYDAEGNITGYLIMLKNGEKTEQFLRIEFEFYSPEEWDAIAQEAIKSQNSG
jgi:hypothetical protein